MWRCMTRSSAAGGGIAGTVFVHKIAGAAAAAGLTLEAVAQEAAAAAAVLGTMGVALGACTVPAAGKPGFSLGEVEMELGLGIHGEQGVRRGALEPADTVVDTILGTLMTQMKLERGARVAVLVNGLGGTPPMELAIVARHALAGLRSYGVQVGAGLGWQFHDGARDARLLAEPVWCWMMRAWRGWDAPSGAPAWPGDGVVGPRRDGGRRPAAVGHRLGCRQGCGGRGRPPGGFGRGCGAGAGRGEPDRAWTAAPATRIWGLAWCAVRWRFAPCRRLPGILAGAR